jgi:hypothetical protein
MPRRVDESIWDFVKRRLNPDMPKPPLVVNENVRKQLNALEATERGERPKEKKK